MSRHAQIRPIAMQTLHHNNSLSQYVAHSWKVLRLSVLAERFRIDHQIDWISSPHHSDKERWLSILHECSASTIHTFSWRYMVSRLRSVDTKTEFLDCVRWLGCVTHKENTNLYTKVIDAQKPELNYYLTHRPTAHGIPDLYVYNSYVRIF